MVDANCLFYLNILMINISLNGCGDNTSVHFTPLSHFFFLTLSGLGKILSKLVKYPPVLSSKSFNKI